jgi:tetratricopeptide (TPR) repeat protein
MPGVAIFYAQPGRKCCYNATSFFRTVFQDPCWHTRSIKVDFRILALGLLFWLCPAWGNITPLLDEVAGILYQTPNQAFKQLLQLEKNRDSMTALESLRLDALKCEALLQLGEDEAAINVAQLGDARAKRLQLDEARPYFLTCQADAHANHDNLETTFLLLDSAITLAKHHQQPQALVNALRLRGQLDTDSENFGSAIEDLRLALDIYPDIFKQSNNWLWSPHAYVYSAMGNLLYATGDLAQGLKYANLALNSKDANGKVRHYVLLSASMLSLNSQDTQRAETLLKEAKALVPDLDSPQEMALSYGILASIEFRLNRLDNARELALISLNTAEKQRKKILSMRVKRLLAQIEFAQGNDAKGLALINEAIRMGEDIEQYFDLKDFYDIISQYYAGISDYKQAYDSLTKGYQAALKASETLSDARFIQFKARLSQQASQQAQISESLLKDKQQQELKLNWAYSAVIACIMLLLIGGLWLLNYLHGRKFHQEQEQHEVQPPLNLQLDAMLNHAKRNDYPLSLLLLNTANLGHGSLPQLQDTLIKELREQDKLVRYSMNELAILLPRTSALGAERVIEQLLPKIQPWQTEGKVSIGMASMQHFDTLVSLVKRAGINQLCKSKPQDTAAHLNLAEGI